MKSQWDRAQWRDHPPVEMRFIDMFMTALGSLVFLALLLVFLLPKTTQSKVKDEEIESLQREIQQLQRQIQQSQASPPGNARTEDKEIVLRRFGVLLVIEGCTAQPELYVRSEGKLYNFKTNEPTGEAAPFDAADPSKKTILVEHSYFSIGAGSGAANVAPLDGNGVQAKGFLGISRSSTFYSVYAGLRNPAAQQGKGCVIYPFYLSAHGLVGGDQLTLTEQRPYAWLRKFKINADGSTTLPTSPKDDEEFKRELAEFSKKQSQVLCARKAVCDTADAHYVLLVPPPPSPGQSHYDQAFAHQSRGELERAIAEYSEAIQLDPKYAAAWYNRGGAYKAKGDLDRAIADYDKSLLIEQNAAGFNDRGLAYAGKGDLDRAIVDYSEAIRIDGKYDPAYYNRGFAYFGKGDVDRAISDYSDALLFNPQYASAYAARAAAYRSKGSLDRAIDDYDKAIGLEPTATRYDERGRAYFEQADFERAITNYAEAIRLDPKLAGAYAHRGDAYSAKGELDRAIADYNDAIGFDPKANAERFNNRGLAYRAKGDLQRALADYDAAIARDPKFAAAYDNRASVLLARGELAHAVADFSSGIGVEPNVSRYTGRGVAFLAQGDPDRAIKDFSQAIRLDPKYEAAYINRGRAFYFNGSIAKAQADFKQANELDPKNVYTALWLDLAERSNNLPSRLTQYAEHIDMSSWPAPLVRFFLGELTWSKLSSAVERDATLASSQKQICDADFYGGELALLQNSRDEALRLFRLAAQNCKEFVADWAAVNGQMTILGASP